MILSTTWLVKYRDRHNQLREFVTTETDFDSANREAKSLLESGERIMHIQYLGEFRKGDRRIRAPKHQNPENQPEAVRQ